MYLKKSIHDKGTRCQFPMGGTFSWRYCKAKSVHFISCSLTDSVVPPLSCSGSGSSFGHIATSRKAACLLAKPRQSNPRRFPLSVPHSPLSGSFDLARPAPGPPQHVLPLSLLGLICVPSHASSTVPHLDSCI